MVITTSLPKVLILEALVYEGFAEPISKNSGFAIQLSNLDLEKTGVRTAKVSSLFFVDNELVDSARK